jgi:hypothetical protein
VILKYFIDLGLSLVDIPSPTKIKTGELLPHRLDHFSPTELRLHGSRHVFAEFAQAIAATALTRGGWIDCHTLARKVIGECVALVLCGTGFQSFEPIDPSPTIDQAST